jgi:hypothetical protein
MKTIIKTPQYDFSIILKGIKNDYAFEITAICKRDKTKSGITNLNFIISELLESFVTFQDYETTIYIDRDAGSKIYHKAIKLFNDSRWLELLIVALDDDKDAGEWS